MVFAPKPLVAFLQAWRAIPITATTLASMTSTVSRSHALPLT